MASVLTSAGVVFGGDSTTITSKYYIFDQNTQQTFYQASAPTGWVQITTSAYDGSALRLRNSVGSSTGGTQFFTNVFSSVAISGNSTANFSAQLQDYTLTTQQIPSHSHAISYSGPGAGYYRNNPGVFKALPGPAGRSGYNTGSTGGGSAHSHTVTANDVSGPYSGSWNLEVKYVDVITCRFL